MARQRIYRSSIDRKIGGVASGIADAFDIDPTFLRIAFIAFGIFGIGIPIYILLWMILPRDPELDLYMDIDEERRPGLFRLLFKVFGILICLSMITHHFGTKTGVLAFAIGAAVGLFFLWRSASDSDDRFDSFRERFQRSSDDRRLMGVFGGLAESFDVDPTLLRIFGTVVILASGTIGFGAYFLLALLMPVRRQQVIIIS